MGIFLWGLKAAIGVSVHAHEPQSSVQRPDSANQPSSDPNPDPGVRLPRLIYSAFYRKSDICEAARSERPPKKAALILLSTHECDSGGNVCISSLTTLSDPANAFVRENFATFHTQFTRWEMRNEGMNQLHFSKEKEIRAEWQKPDTMPEIAIMDLKTCKVIGRKHMHDHPNAFKKDFMKRYVAVRETVLAIPGAQALLKVPPTLQPAEIARVRALRARAPELSTIRVYRAAAIVSERVQSVADHKIHRNNSDRVHRLNSMGAFFANVQGKKFKPIETPVLKTDKAAQEEASYEYDWMSQYRGGPDQNQVGRFYYCPKEGCSKLPAGALRAK